MGRADRRIHALAGVRPDTGRSLTIPSIGRNLAEGADFLLGHNLIDFDLPHLRAANPNLRRRQLPAMDTRDSTLWPYPAIPITNW